MKERGVRGQLVEVHQCRGHSLEEAGICPQKMHSTVQMNSVQFTNTLFIPCGAMPSDGLLKAKIKTPLLMWL